MGLLGGLFGGVGKAAEGIGNAVTKVYRTTKGDKSQIEAGIQAVEGNVHDEQMAVLSQYAAEVATRKTATWFDSLIDGLNRLQRPFVTFSVIGAFFYCFYDPVGFAGYMQALDMAPDELWTMWLAIFAFLFGGRFVSEDMRKPRLTREQKEKALEIIRDREKAIVEARTPLIVEVTPTRKPAMPDREREEPKKPLEEIPEPKPIPRPGSIDRMIDMLISREGGYVNHPADRGGPTNFGITKSTLAAWRGHDVTEDDVKHLTVSEASEIYRTRYYFAPDIGSLPAGIQEHVFDIGVNCGPRTGIKLLQRALNNLGSGIKDDGVIGPETRAAAERYPIADINRALVGVRLQYYDDLVTNDPTQVAFIKGWRNRANSFMEA